MYSDADLLVAVFFAAVVGTPCRLVAVSDGPRQAHRRGPEVPAAGVAAASTPWQRPEPRPSRASRTGHDPVMTRTTVHHLAQGEASGVLDCCNARRPTREVSTTDADHREPRRPT